MSELLQSIRAKYPVYADTPDDELTVGVGDKYPVYLSQDPQFRAEYLKAKAQTSFSGLGDIQPPGATQPRLATTPAVTGAEAAQPTQIEAVKREAQQAIPALSPEEAEKIVTTPFVSLPRMSDKEMPVTSAMVNVGEGLIEQALLTPASGALMTAFQVPGVRTIVAGLIGGAAVRSGYQQAKEGTETGNRQQIAEGILTGGLGVAGATGLIPQASKELGKFGRFIDEQTSKPEAPTTIGVERQLPAPSIKMPEFSQSTLEPSGGPRRALPAPGETEGSVLLPESPLGPRTAGYRIQLPVSEGVKVKEGPVIDIEAQVEGADALRQLTKMEPEQKTPGQPYQPPTVNVDLRQLERVLQRNTVSKVENWADQVIQDKLRGASSNPFLDPEFMAAAATKGALLFKRGITEFAEWSNEMQKQFGRGMEDHLPLIFNQSRDYWKQRETEVQNASGQQEAAKVGGSMLRDDETRQASSGVPVDESGKGVQPQTQGRVSPISGAGIGPEQALPQPGLNEAILDAISEGGMVKGIKRGGDKSGHYVVAPPEGPEDSWFAVGPFKDTESAKGFLDAEVGAPGAKVIQVDRTGKPISKPPPSSSETVPQTEAPAWDKVAEVRRNKEGVFEWIENGEVQRTSSDFADLLAGIHESNAGYSTRVRQVSDRVFEVDLGDVLEGADPVHELIPLGKNKPPSTISKTAPELQAPAAAAVSEAKPPSVAAPGEPPAISQATTEGQKAQAVDPVEKFVGSVGQVPEGKAPPTIQKPLGVTPFPGVTEALGRLVNAGKAVVNEIRSAPAFTPFKEALNAWNGKNQLASLQIRRLQKTLESKVKDPLRREAISNWLQADGDTSKLAGWEAASKGTRKAGYKAAQNLTPDEVKVAQSVRQLYDDLLARAQAYGILDQGLENYVTQIWKRPLIPGSGMTQFMSKLSRNFKFARQRTFENFFEGEQSGFKPVTKDISQLLGLYVSELEKTIATRDLIKDLTTKTASDGNPLAMPEGVATVLTDEAGDASGPMFVKPGVLKSEVPYAQIDNPALAKWKWATKDPESGRDVFMLGELRVHPEIARHLRNALGQSQIAKWLREPSPSAMLNVAKGAGRLAATASQLTKEVMLGTLSTFHHVQEGTHAVGHRINPFMPDKMPIDAPEFKDALSHGLQVAGDRAALENFREGLGAQALFGKLGPVGRFIQRHNDFLFNEYIPRLKWATYQAILDRNMARFEPELRSGRVSDGDVKYLSAQQANAAYGHLNYADLGRNPTVQHFLRLAALAPDFLEARSRFAGQAIKGLTGKAGREQLEALAILAGTFYVGARILNKMTTGDWNTDEPFGVRVGNRTYRMRSVPEDIWRLFKDTRQFVYGRLNPIFGRGTAELLTGRNYRGEKITASETFKEALTSWIPIQMRGLPGFKSLTETQRNATINAWEQFLGSIGIQVSRYSPVSKVYQLANDWRKAQGEKEDRGTYPISKYQPMRYALEDGDLKAAEIEYNKLVATGLTPPKIMLGFREALNHPFTGSVAKDRAFKNSLTPENKALYDEALQQRRRIWNQFQTMRSGVGIKP